MKQGIVTKAHKTSYPNPLIAIKGTMLKIIKSDPAYPGWLWCEDATSLDGWVPVAYMKINGDSAELVRDYDAMELTVPVGEELMILDEEPDWFLCRTSEGKEGWVPKANIQIQS